ncbi:glycosyltransferase family 4 protein [Rhodocaloribacter litoris]|uniref:glycosyltransferase family 4 protein n=1 Tax=Rhodocaloribacter litoris TaxID=2558931 RepID=UPI001E5FD7D6|nr:glycosyltransferase family 4 protein [Rhodocaloribacter litoris]QXD16179.1 glycosyltransferase family 4 protein [Rhodocaloribacter litoris]
MLVVRHAPAPDAPYDPSLFAWIDRLYDRHTLSRAEMLEKIRDFRPDVLFMAGWFDRDYLAVARAMRKDGIPVIAGCDTQWTGSLRQRMASVVAPWYLHPAIDVLWVSGERQRQLARRLGYAGPRCWTGIYACDHARFAAVYREGQARPRVLLFVGRYIPIKGLDTLLAAYRRYRAMTPEPWALYCAGTGELASLLEGEEGVTDLGFVQPDRLPEIFAGAGAFVLPSRREPWGVVVQEAAAAGLPLLCSTASGASVHLVQDGYNGFLFEPKDADHLAALMLRLTRMTPAERLAMSRASHLLSQQFTPGRWAETFVQGVVALGGGSLPVSVAHL